MSLLSSKEIKEVGGWKSGENKNKAHKHMQKLINY